MLSTAIADRPHEEDIGVGDKVTENNNSTTNSELVQLLHEQLNKPPPPSAQKIIEGRLAKIRANAKNTPVSRNYEEDIGVGDKVTENNNSTNDSELVQLLYEQLNKPPPPSAQKFGHSTQQENHKGNIIIESKVEKWLMEEKYRKEKKYRDAFEKVALFRSQSSIDEAKRKTISILDARKKTLRMEKEPAFYIPRDSTNSPLHDSTNSPLHDSTNSPLHVAFKIMGVDSGGAADKEFNKFMNSAGDDPKIPNSRYSRRMRRAIYRKMSRSIGAFRSCKRTKNNDDIDICKRLAQIRIIVKEILGDSYFQEFIRKDTVEFNIQNSNNDISPRDAAIVSVIFIKVALSLLYKCITPNSNKNTFTYISELLFLLHGYVDNVANTYKAEREKTVAEFDSVKHDTIVTSWLKELKKSCIFIHNQAIETSDSSSVVPPPS